MQDYKLANLLVVHGLVKVSDLGISKLLEAENTTSYKLLDVVSVMSNPFHSTPTIPLQQLSYRVGLFKLTCTGQKGCFVMFCPAPPCAL